MLRYELYLSFQEDVTVIVLLRYVMFLATYRKLSLKFCQFEDNHFQLKFAYLKDDTKQNTTVLVPKEKSENPTGYYPCRIVLNIISLKLLHSASIYAPNVGLRLTNSLR